MDEVPMGQISIPHCVIVISVIASHASYVACKGRKPSPDEKTRSSTHYLIDHSKKIRIDSVKSSNLNIVIEISNLNSRIVCDKIRY